MTTSKPKPQTVRQPTIDRHDFESEHGAREGGGGPCAVCGEARQRPQHR